ncbi:MAG: hypothetical protein M3Z92_02500 [Bacteroidota bacterium]|nr:hypothetical protein [Bacteroidota bacterium]
MGLSIHYSGCIRDKALVDPLIEEVKDICETLEWKSQTFDDDKIKGICFAPEGSEPVFLTFNQNGRLLSPINIVVKEIYDGVQLDKDLIFTTSTKTQYAGPDAHIAIIKLLKHISGKYFNDFTLSDEGYYWETGDEKILLNQFQKYNAAIDSFCEALEGLTAVSGEAAESLADRIESLLRKKFGGKKE